MSADRILHRCAGPAVGIYCEEVTARQAAAAQAIADDCWTHAEQLVAAASRIAEVHRQDHELRQGRP